MKAGQFKIFRFPVAGIVAVSAQTAHRFPRHTHDQFGIGVIERGAQRSLSGRGIVEAGTGDVITLNPNEVHDGAPIGDGRAWSMLYLDPVLIAEALDDIGEGQSTLSEFPHPVMHDKQLAASFRRLFSLVVAFGDQQAALPREELLLALVAGVAHKLDRYEDGDGAPTAIAQARALMDDDPAASVTLADLADASGLSRFQVLRGFAKATGLTPHAYLMQQRVHRAKRLIGEGMPLAEAAFACGFADQSHMTRIFTRNYGVSPGAYAAAVR